jgi:hypothetical protein
MIVLVPALTPEFNYAPTGLRTLGPDQEIKDRYFELASLMDVSEGDIARMGNTRTHLSGSASELLTNLHLPEGVADFAAEYRRFLAGDVARAWKLSVGGTRRLDYLILPGNQPIPTGVQARFPNARIMYENEGYRLLDCTPLSQE